MESSKGSVWKVLLQIERGISSIYKSLPFHRLLSKVVVRLPFSSFYFRPRYLDELYMALGLWEPYVRRVLAYLLRKGDNVILVDVGAHIGYYVVFSSNYIKNGLIIAIEPDTRNLSVLNKNIKANNIRNVLVYRAALGFDGFTYLDLGMNPVVTRTSRTLTKMKVPSISLDSLYKELERRTFDSVIVKMDIEGGELDVIRSGSTFIKQLSPIFIVETGVFSELSACLRRFGYVGKRMFRSYYIFYGPRSALAHSTRTLLKMGSEPRKVWIAR